MRHLIAAKISDCAAILWLSAAIIGLPPSLASAQELAAPASGRVTTSFELKAAEAVLKKVSRIFTGGFERAQAEQLARDIAAMKSETPMSWDFRVLYKGVEHPLRVKALIDDLGMVDLDFTTSPDLAPLVRAAVDGYLNGRNF
jgi:hypothetical protein